jgi:pimeloyl-ACP methyl ester carboxylesterase
MTVRRAHGFVLRLLLCAFLAGVAWSGSLVETSLAQRRRPPIDSPLQDPQPARGNADDEEPPVKEPPAKKLRKQKANPERLTLETRDGLALNAAYYPPIRPSKDVVPVILLHMAKGSSADWAPLALSLQRAGHAVIVPDLRGHGESTQINRGGVSATLDQATMRKGDFEAMVTQDLERVKKFLVEENNKENLNIRKLCVVGAELGAAVAINWAALDWSWPPLATGPQGQDVNGLVLITPIWSHKGMTIVNATKQDDLQRAISVMIIAGAKDSANLKEARRLHQIFERFHDEPPAAQMAEKKDLFIITPPTSLQGTKMLSERSLNVERNIQEFIQLRLVRKNFPWGERRMPLQ